jgi:hypothetical protein
MESFLNRLYGFDKSKTENRKHLRFSLPLPAECHYKAGEKPQECRLVDVSEEGVGFELDTHVDMRYGQKVLLSIFLPERKTPVSAIVKLQWVKIPHEGPLKQRLGSLLLFIDPKDKAQLLEHAHAMMLVGMAKNNFAARALDIRYPKIPRTKR